MNKRFIKTTSSKFESVNKEQYKDCIIFIEDTKEIWTNGNYYGRNDGIQPSSVSLTYSELKQLRDSSSLIPGTQYRITDYISTTTQEGTTQEWCPFDVIVIANSIDTLNESAFAIQHDGDIYFSNSNLSAWKLKYCLDNDESRFLWADTINGKGVIYELIDEFNNSAPFDFKSIKINSYVTLINHYIFASNLEIEADDYSLTGNVVNNKINPCFNENGQQIINGVFMSHEYNDCQIKNNYIGYNVNNVHIIEQQGTTISNNNIGNNNSYIHMQGTNINNYHVAANTNNAEVYELSDIDNSSHLKLNVAKKSNSNIVVYNEADLIAG